MNSTHYGELIYAVENVSDTSVNSIGSVESSKRRGKAKVYYLVKSFDSKEDALSFLVNEVYEEDDLLCLRLNQNSLFRNKLFKIDKI